MGDVIYNLVAWLIPLDCLQLRFMQRALCAIALLAPACALLGVPVVNLRMAFFSDAIGHAALAGVAAGLLIGIDPHISTMILALMMAAGILWVQSHSRLSTDTVIGVLAAGVVATGLALISRHREITRETTRFLYGDILTVTDADVLTMGIFTLVVIGILAWRSNRLLALSLNADLARAHGRLAAFDRWLFAAVLAIATVLAVRAVGVLLVTAMLIVPAATARNLGRSAASQPWIAAAVGLCCGVLGLIASAQSWCGAAAGPTMVLLSVLCFVASTVWLKIR